MKDITFDILNKYKIRKSARQKIDFETYIKKSLESYNLKITVEESGLIKSRNIIIGDISKAQVIIGAHYDTCAVLPFPNIITPQRMWIYILYQVLLASAMIVASAAFAFITELLIKNHYISIAVYVAVLLSLIFLLIFGKANKNNYNDNTSGVITVVQTALKLEEQYKYKAAFVLFDNEEKGLLGSMQFAKKHKADLKDKALINLDCVSDGDNILIIPDKHFKADCVLIDKLKSVFISTNEKNIIISEKKYFYPSDQMSFKKTLGIASMKYSKILGLYMDKIHTAKDTVFDERNITLLTDSLINFIKII